MEWWLVLLATLLALALCFVLPWRVDLSLEARGEPGGFWAIAGGLTCGPLGVTGITAREVSPTVQLRVFGRTMKTLRPDRKLPKSVDEVARGVQKARDSVDWLPLAQWIVGEHKRFRIRRLDIETAYSFADVVRTGQMIAATSILAGFLPPPVRLRSAPSWELVDRASLGVNGSFRIWPGLFLLDALRFWTKNRRVFKRKVEA